MSSTSLPTPSSEHPTPSSRRPLIIAVLVGTMVLAAVIGVFVLRDDSSGSDGAGEPAAPPAVPDLAGTKWKVVAISGTDAAPAPAIKTDGSLTVDIDNDDTFAYTGCNGGAGDMKLDGNQLTVAEVRSTMMACADPDGEILMAWDAWMATLLGDGVTVTTSGADLVLTGATGSVTLRPA